MPMAHRPDPSRNSFANDRVDVRDTIIGAGSLPLGATPADWKQQLAYAMSEVDPNGEYSTREYLASFENHYGPCTIEGMIHFAHAYTDERKDSLVNAQHRQLEAGSALQSQRSAYTQFVLLMLGVSPDHPLAMQARSALVPFLQSPNVTERWASAISLGHLRDERAIPTLLEMLTEGLPQPQPWPDEDEVRREQRWIQFADNSFQAEMVSRYQIPLVLARWAVQFAIPSLRHALDIVARIECTETRRHESSTHQLSESPMWSQNWRTYQNHLVWSLGRLGAFGALTGIELPEEDFRMLEVYRQFPTSREYHLLVHSNPRIYRGQVWRVHMCLGFLSGQERGGGNGRAFKQTELVHEVNHLLQDEFGLDQQEREDALMAYGDLNIPLLRYR